MKTSEPGRLTRVQVQEKLKRNFQVLCARCPQLANNYEVLDDSLTSLHWLSNLNVNIGGPVKESGRDGPGLRSNNLLPSFPSNPLKNGQPSPTSGVPNVFSPGEITYAKRNWNVQAPKGSPSPISKLRNGGSRKASAKNTRNASAPTLGRSSHHPPSSDSNQRTLHSASVASSKMVVRGLPINPPATQTHNGSQFSDAPAIAIPGWGHDIVDVKPPNTLKNSSHSSHLPQIQLVTSKQVPTFEEPHLSVASPTPHYSFSPREAMLDLLPGQVDYKNNPYVKPTFSYTTLICMALQSGKKRRMSFSSICKWITDNFMYYRYADLGWQNSVKLNLTKSKYFSKVSKKDSAVKSYLWEINPACNIKLRDSNSPILLGNLRRNDPRLEPVQISPASSLSLPSVPILPKFDKDEGPNFSNRKRKQAMPQKAVRRRNVSAKKRRNNVRSAGNRNLLQEEAPELGSLKGDFNWNTIFDEFFGATEAALSVTPTSLASRPSTNEGNEMRDVNTSVNASDDVTNGALLALDMLSLPDLPEPATNDENNETPPTSQESTHAVPWQVISNTKHVNPNEKSPAVEQSLGPPALKPIELPLLEDCNLFLSESDAPDIESLNVDDLDLTITGKQIAPPEVWIPVSPELEAILCETQNDEVIFQHPSDPLDVDNLFLLDPSTQDNPDQYLSPVEVVKKRRQKSRKADPGFDCESIMERNSPSLKKQNNFWQRGNISTFQ